MGIVQGSAEQAKPLIVGIDTVYVHSDITKIETEDGSELYQYRETQYEKDEYIKYLSDENADLQEQITSAQVALCDVYEMLG
ncbi:MAG: hypothetical protein MR324_06995 [Lachnospiraceae bacterium]|nr:hypothetical protein [Lachnospiraceae bacterium]